MTKKRYLLGLDIGSSSIKASVMDADTGKLSASSQSPLKEMEIFSPRPGWAEQSPDTWWKHVKLALASLKDQKGIDLKGVTAVGISYQMHGLVTIDESFNPIRPAIIWCDGRSVEIGRQAFLHLGKDFCLSHFLNSPGNFTASKLKWIKEHEPENFNKIHKILLPGDYIALKLSRKATTTLSGLSEGILWDFKKRDIASSLLEYYQIPDTIIPPALPNFTTECRISSKASEETGLPKGVPISYRAGDQPNNALSLNVLEPGEIAATAGTSGVIYGVTDKANYDPLNRVNTFLHVNDNVADHRNGILACINGTGIFYSWLRGILFNNQSPSYDQINEMGLKTAPGADGLFSFPFGNGAERLLENKDLGASFSGVNFNRHRTPHFIRSCQEGIAFAFSYGINIMRDLNTPVKKIKAGKANLFLSPLFTRVLAAVNEVEIEIYDTDGALGAARGAGIGANIFSTFQEAFEKLEHVDSVFPDHDSTKAYQPIYGKWLEKLNDKLTN